MPIAAPGSMGVDWEIRVDYDRLRRERLERAKDALNRSSLGSILCFDMNNIRYLTSTHIGEWARDKFARYSLLPRGGEPMLWDFGSAAKVHQMYSPWIADRSFAGVAGMRGAIPIETGHTERWAKQIKNILEEHGLAKEPVGIDVAEIPIIKALEAEGLEIADGQQVMLDAREIKTDDEITLLTMAAMLVDSVYDEIFRSLRPGIRENDVVAIANKKLYELGSDNVEAINAISGERTNPHPHVFSDRVIRPGDLVFFDILQAYNGYRTCYYRTFLVGERSTPEKRAVYQQAYEWIQASIEQIRPGRTTADIASAWPKAEEFGFANEEAAFGLQFGHGIGLSIWERPVLSRLFSLDAPKEIKPGMVFAVETYCGSKDGKFGARIEEEIVVTETGHEVITKFPCDELLVAGIRYWEGGI